MALRISRLGFIGLVTLPLISANCGNSEDRNFTPGGSAGAGASGGSAGSTGGSSATGGSAGSTGGSAGSTGGSAGSTGGTAGGDGGIACTDASECDDKNPCNGEETCTANLCAPGTPLADGESCTPDYGDAGAPDGGGAEFVCAAQICALKCDSDDDCEDNSICTGKEICHPTSKTCLSGTPLTCDDSDLCTENQCDPTTGCFYPLVDADGDGHAASTIGACGDDCDDNDPTIYAGAAEACDNKDNNCNGATDEAAPLWYVDCDGDGFAPAGSVGVQQCTKPAAPDPSCGATGDWTIQVPASGTSDCWDKDAKAHPMTASENNSAWQSVPMSGSAPVSIDYDYNCDGTEEKKPLGKTGVSASASCTYATGNSCLVIQPLDGSGGSGGTSGKVSGAAGIGGIGGVGGIGPGLKCCLGSDGWTGSGPTTCGGSATYTECDFLGTSSCLRVTGSKKLECR